MSRPRRTGRLATATILTVVGVVALSAFDGASAGAPSKDGWWSAGNAGTVAAPAPPDVPSKGLYVENGFNGPTAISALTFTLPDGSRAGTLTLQTAGAPVITSAPVACPLTAAAQGYRPVENGAWSARPAYDCSSKVTGTVSSDKKTVTFAVGPLAHDGVVAIALIAGGKADRVPFAPPSTTALATTGGGTTAAPTTPTGTTSSGSYGGSTATSTPGAIGSGAGSVGGALAGLTPAGPADTLAPPSSPDVAAAPAGAGQAPVTAGPPGGGSASSNRPAASATTGTSGSHTTATAIGLAAMVAALLFWAEGFGLLGGRVSSFAARRQGPAPDDVTLSEAAPAAPAHS